MQLCHLPLRPSTLEVFTVAGFVQHQEVLHAKTHGGLQNLAAELNVSVSHAHSLFGEVMDCLPKQQQQQKETSKALLQQRPPLKQPRHIITFCRALDTLLGGGLALGSVTEVCGKPGSGKTALCMQVAANAALPKQSVGGLQSQCLYIDTEGSFCPSRLYDMVVANIEHVERGLQARVKKQKNSNKRPRHTAWQTTPEAILNGIHVVRVHDLATFWTVLYSLPEWVQRLGHNNETIQCVIIDSVAFPFRSNSQNDDFLVRTKQLSTVCTLLHDLAQQFQVAVLVTNQMTTKKRVDTNNHTTTRLIPALGESWSHAVGTRLILHSNATNNNTNPTTTRLAELVKSPHMPPKSCQFEIGPRGVRDPNPQR